VALTTRRGTGRFRCQRTDPAGVWNRLEPREKALQRQEKEFIYFITTLTFKQHHTTLCEVISSHMTKQQEGHESTEATKNSTFWSVRPNFFLPPRLSKERSLILSHLSARRKNLLLYEHALI